MQLKAIVKNSFRAKETVSFVLISFLLFSCGRSYYTTLFRKVDLDERSIAILPFDNESVDFDATPIFRHAINSYLGSRGFKMIPLANIDKTLNELGVLEAGEVRAFTPRELGDFLGADYLLYGTVTEFNTKYLIAYSSINVEGFFELYDTYNGEKTWEARSGSYSNNFTRIFFVGDLIEFFITLDIEELITNNDFVKIFKKSHHDIISDNFLRKNVRYRKQSPRSSSVSIDSQTARLIMEGARAGTYKVSQNMSSDDKWLVAAVIFLTWTLLYAMFDNYDNYVIELVVKGFADFPS